MTSSLMMLATLPVFLVVVRLNHKSSVATIFPTCKQVHSDSRQPLQWLTLAASTAKFFFKYLDISSIKCPIIFYLIEILTTQISTQHTFKRSSYSEIRKMRSNSFKTSQKTCKISFQNETLNLPRQNLDPKWPLKKKVQSEIGEKISLAK